MRGRWDGLALAAALVYVLATGWAMANTSYDIWGAFFIAPVIVAVTVPMLRRLFAAEHAEMFPILVAGLVAKLAGSMFRYWVAFDAYAGSADAGRYHDYATVMAADVRAGVVSPWEAVPHGVGTPFLERLTTLVYTVFGSSRLAAFFLFAWMGFWGACCLCERR